MIERLSHDAFWSSLNLPQVFPLPLAVPKPRTPSFPLCSFLGLQFVVTRTLDGELKAYSNTCRHKGTVIAQGEGTCKNFVCPFHVSTLCFLSSFCQLL
jgi:hypothetical protein